MDVITTQSKRHGIEKLGNYDNFLRRAYQLLVRWYYERRKMLGLPECVDFSRRFHNCGGGEDIEETTF